MNDSRVLLGYVYVKVKSEGCEVYAFSRAACHSSLSNISNGVQHWQMLASKRNTPLPTNVWHPADGVQRQVQSQS